MALHLEVVQSTFWETNTSIITDPDGGIVLIDPGVFPDELAALASRVGEGRILAVIATHEDWDHVLWSRDFPPAIPRYAHPATASVLKDQRNALLNALTKAEAELSVHWDPELVGEVQPIPGNPFVIGGHIRIALVPTPGHTPGHTSLWLQGDGILFAGDMLSDVDLPLPALTDGTLAEYISSLATLEALIPHAWTVVPGHGTSCGPEEARNRLQRDREYVEALSRRDEEALEWFAIRDGRMGRPSNRDAHADAVQRLRNGSTDWRDSR